MKTDNGHNGKSPRRRGNVLVLAILMTMLLFILGIAFLSTTMIEKSTVASLGNEEYLDSGVQIVVERINEVLVDDLFQGTNYDAAVLNNPERLYDYPDDNNFWLASLEPEFDDGSFTGYPPHYFWRHITDLWRRFNDPQTPGPGNPEIRWYDPDEKDEATGAYVQQVRQDGPAGDLFKVSGHHVPIRVVAEDEPINVFFSGGVPVYHGPVLDGIDPRPSGWPTNPPPDPYKIDGMRADADGDGVVDARWVRLGRQGPKGEYLWAAVRIVDNGGKININTAFRNPEHPVEGADPGINPRRWDGSRLSHVDLIGIRAVGDDGIPMAAIEGHRYGSVAFDPADYLNDTQYEMEVARRILNPFRPGIGLEYQPFGKTDELDLANRYLLRSPMTNAGSFPSQLWPVTFNPPPGQVGKQYPYTQDMPINPSSFDIAPARPLNAWYDHVTPDGDVPGFYNRRHLFTTYSFDRILRPESVDPLDSITRCEDLPGQRKVALLLPNEGSGNGIGDGQFSGFADAASRDEYWEVLVGALYRGLPANNTNRVQDRFGNNTNFGYDREKLARCWALNLIDLQDTDIDIIATPPVDNDKPTVQTVGDTTYYGLESLDILQRHTLFISKLGYVEIDPNQPGTCPMGKYYAIELFNPDGRPNTAQALSTYEIRVMDRSDNLKFSLDLGSLTTVVQDSDPLDPTGSPPSFEKDTAVVGFYNSTANDVFEDSTESANYPSPETATQNAFSGWQTGSNFDVIENPSSFHSDMVDSDYKIVLVNTALNDMPVDCVVVPSTLTSSTGPNVVYRRYVIPGTRLLLPDSPAHSGFASSYPWEKGTSAASPDRLGDDIDPRDKGVGGHLVAVTDPANSAVHEDFAGFQIKLAETSAPLATVGQAAGVPVVGYWYYENGNTHRCMTVWQSLVESLVMIKHLNGTADLTADQDRGVELGSYGRIRLDDPLFMNWDPTATPPQKANVFDLVTYFDPSGDREAGSTKPVDNDGNPWTSNDPVDDDFDQDEDGVDLPVYLGGGMPGDVDADETLPRWYEQAVPGRININTAPWYVIAQLPWLQEPSLAAGAANRYKLARAIVAYRDMTRLVADGVDYYWGVNVTNRRKTGMGLPVAAPDVREEPGFVSVYELLNVTQDPTLPNYDPWFDIRRYGRDMDTVSNSPVNNNPVGSGNPGPFYSEDDYANDVTERDILFQRISNLVTVRSDVFTAYILVRIGQAGPQKRMIAVFDRSTVFNRGDVPRLVALHPVPDPR